MPRLWDAAPFVAMVIVSCLDSGLTTLSKAAMSKGMSHYIFVFYSNVLATLLVFPASFILQRKSRPPITFPILCRFFILGSLWIPIMQVCIFTGVNYSSPSLGSAMGNLIPAFTVPLAFIFRLERLQIRSSSTQAKLLGITISIFGALVVTFYKGPLIETSSQHHPLRFEGFGFNGFSSENWVLGAFFLAIASLSVSVLSILRTLTTKIYPSKMTIISFSLLFGTLQCGAVCLIAERHPTAWRLKPDIELTSIVYSAICGSVITAIIHLWCMEKKGPVFVTMFSPLLIPIAAFMSSVFLGETLHVGSVVGAVIVVVGLYGVVWGKATEENVNNADCVGELVASTEKTPLLPSRQLAV